MFCHLSSSNHTGLLSAPHTPHTPVPSSAFAVSSPRSTPPSNLCSAASLPSSVLAQMSPQGNLPYHSSKGAPRTPFPYPAPALSEIISVYLLAACLILKTGSSLQVGTLLCSSPWLPCPRHGTHRCSLNGWLSSLCLPSYLVFLSLSSCFCLLLFFSPLIHILLTPSSRSHIYASLRVFFSHTTHLHLCLAWHLEHFCPLATPKGTWSQPA